MLVSDLKLEEPVHLNADRLEEICDELGYSGGEEAICLAMESLAVMLHESVTTWRSDDMHALEQVTRQIAGVADRIGMAGLARVSDNVLSLCGGRDTTALAATVARMRRLGEQSLLAIWDRQDLTI